MTKKKKKKTWLSFLFCCGISCKDEVLQKRKEKSWMPRPKELKGRKVCQLTVYVHIPIYYVCNNLCVGGCQSEWVPPRTVVWEN